MATTVFRSDATPARLEALAEEQAALRRVATLVATDVDAGRVFNCVCEELGRVLGVDSTDVMRYEGDGTATMVGGWAGSAGPSFPVGMSVPVEGETVCAKLYRTGRPQRVDDYRRVDSELAARLRSHGMLSAAGAPIIVAGRLWGGLMAASRHAYSFPEGTEHRIADFAELVTAALANADARDQLAASRARIVEAGYAERRRLERDLHDGAQQELVSAAMNLSRARQNLPEDASAGRELVEAALEQVQAGLRDLRELAAGIHPGVLTDRGLRAALEGLAARSPLVVELGPVVGERLPAPIETTAYFVVAEALTNAAKHARCDRAEVRVRREGDWAVVEVRDDGVGGAAASAGSGLRGLADRVSALGGHLEIDSPPGRGTTLEARLAVAPRDGGHHSLHGLPAPAASQPAP
jgi:signal transduction histidine kinase